MPTHNFESLRNLIMDVGIVVDIIVTRNEGGV